MTSAELSALIVSEKDALAALPDLQEVILYGSALLENELKDDANLLVIPARVMTEGEKVDLRQAVWSIFKDRVPVMLDVVAASEEFDVPVLAERHIPMRIVFTR